MTTASDNLTVTYVREREFAPTRLPNLEEFKAMGIHLDPESLSGDSPDSFYQNYVRARELQTPVVAVPADSHEGEVVPLLAQVALGVSSPTASGIEVTPVGLEGESSYYETHLFAREVSHYVAIPLLKPTTAVLGAGPIRIFNMTQALHGHDADMRQAYVAPTSRNQQLAVASLPSSMADIAHKIKTGQQLGPDDLNRLQKYGMRGPFLRNSAWIAAGVLVSGADTMIFFNEDDREQLWNDLHSDDFEKFAQASYVATDGSANGLYMGQIVAFSMGSWRVIQGLGEQATPWLRRSHHGNILASGVYFVGASILLISELSKENPDTSVILYASGELGSSTMNIATSRLLLTSAAGASSVSVANATLAYSTTYPWLIRSGNSAVYLYMGGLGVYHGGRQVYSVATSDLSPGRRFLETLEANYLLQGGLLFIGAGIAVYVEVASLGAATPLLLGAAAYISFGCYFGIDEFGNWYFGEEVKYDH